MVQVADPFGSGTAGGGSLGLQLALDSGDQWLVDLHTPVAEGTPGYATPILDEPLADPIPEYQATESTVLYSPGGSSWTAPTITAKGGAFMLGMVILAMSGFRA